MTLEPFGNALTCVQTTDPATMLQHLAERTGPMVCAPDPPRAVRQPVTVVTTSYLADVHLNACVSMRHLALPGNLQLAVRDVLRDVLLDTDVQPRVYTCKVIDAYQPNPTATIGIGEQGYVLQPGELYLGHTLEQVGSDTYVPLLFGRSSVGRLGLFVEITAPIGDIGFHGQWTLMLSPVRPLRVYAGMKIGQIMFFVSTGTVEKYTGKYQASVGPQASRYWHEVRLSRSAPGRAS